MRRFLFSLLLLGLMPFCNSFADVAFVDSTFVTGSETTITGWDPGSGITDGLLIAVVSYEDNAAGATESGVTFGGTSMTVAFDDDFVNQTNRYQGVSMWYLKDTDFDGVGSQNLSVSWSTPPQTGETILSLWVFSGVGQPTPIPDFDSTSIPSSVGPVTLSLTAGAGTMTFYAGNFGTGGQTFTHNNGETELYDLSSSGGSSTHTTGLKLNHTTPSITSTGTANRPIVISGLVMAASGGGPAATGQVMRTVIID